VSAREEIDLGLVPPAALQLCARLREKGKRAWIVGGCVRDTLLGREVNDWDVCTDALPAETMRIFPRAIPTGIDHGTITVMTGAVPYEVTTLRGERGYSDGRRPDEVFFTDDLAADLARRDFTVNAMAVDPTDGKLVDPWGGARDLDAKVLRAVGNADERSGRRASSRPWRWSSTRRPTAPSARRSAPFARCPPSGCATSGRRR
jgi:tRNA nucleotidyltransferase (CCA-adding enzyme)